jgi:hypothetical protein
LQKPKHGLHIENAPWEPGQKFWTPVAKGITILVVSISFTKDMAKLYRPSKLKPILVSTLAYCLHASTSHVGDIHYLASHLGMRTMILNFVAW